MQTGARDSALGADMLAMEREVLRAVCQLVRSGKGPLQQEQLRRLEQYRFHDPTHQVIFDTLAEVHKSFDDRSAPQTESLQEHLARLLTRKGFPDVDLETIFQPSHLNERDLERCIHRLMTVDKRAVNENPD